MGRPAGARNASYEATRAELAAKVLPAIIRLGAEASFNELARAAGVSIPTLKHYFADRPGVVSAALRTARDQGATYVAEVADPKGLSLVPSLTKVATDLARAWVPFGVGRMFTNGLAAGLRDEASGHGYLDGILEPTVLALEERLRVHARRGEARLDPDDALDVRTAALAFLSPVLVALIHQHGLSGTTCRPLAIDRFIERHIAAFVTAHGAVPPPGRRAKARRPAR